MLALFAAAFFWGTTFAAQSIGAEYVGPFTYLTIRSYIGTLFLLPFILLRSHFRKKSGIPVGPGKHSLIKAGLCCGLFLFIASALQQYGIGYSSTANASFITAMYVVIVPVISLFFGKKPGTSLWISVVLCVVGLYLLCMTDSLKLSYGDFFLLLCAFGYTFQIMTINYFSPKVDGLKLSAAQFFTVAVISTVCMILFEKPDPALLYKALPTMIYAGIFSNGIAYTCQIIGQKRVKPTVASLIMCLESVFGTLSGYLILHERLTSRKILGCILMFAAIILCTIPSRNRKEITA